jgi:hypothetical protein
VSVWHHSWQFFGRSTKRKKSLAFYESGDVDTHNLYTSEVFGKGSSALGIFVFCIINVFKGSVDFS